MLLIAVILDRKFGSINDILRDATKINSVFGLNSLKFHLPELKSFRSDPIYQDLMFEKEFSTILKNSQEINLRIFENTFLKVRPC